MPGNRFVGIVLLGGSLGLWPGPRTLGLSPRPAHAVPPQLNRDVLPGDVIPTDPEARPSTRPAPGAKSRGNLNRGAPDRPAMGPPPMPEFGGPGRDPFGGGPRRDNAGPGDRGAALWAEPAGASGISFEKPRTAFLQALRAAGEELSKGIAAKIKVAEKKGDREGSARLTGAERQWKESNRLPELPDLEDERSTFIAARKEAVEELLAAIKEARSNAVTGKRYHTADWLDGAERRLRDSPTEDSLAWLAPGLTELAGSIDEFEQLAILERGRLIAEAEKLLDQRALAGDWSKARPIRDWLRAVRFQEDLTRVETPADLKSGLDTFMTTLSEKVGVLEKRRARLLERSASAGLMDLDREIRRLGSGPESAPPAGIGSNRSGRPPGVGPDGRPERMPPELDRFPGPDRMPPVRTDSRSGRGASARTSPKAAPGTPIQVNDGYHAAANDPSWISRTAPKQGVLIGFHVSYITLFGRKSIGGLVPLYRVDGRQVEGEPIGDFRAKGKALPPSGGNNRFTVRDYPDANETVVARAGYGIRSITCKRSVWLEGFEIEFAKIGPSGELTGDSYRAPVMGNMTGGGNPIETEAAGTVPDAGGQPAIGAAGYPDDTNTPTHFRTLRILVPAPE